MGGDPQGQSGMKFERLTTIWSLHRRAPIVVWVRYRLEGARVVQLECITEL